MLSLKAVKFARGKLLLLNAVLISILASLVRCLSVAGLLNSLAGWMSRFLQRTNMSRKSVGFSDG